VRILAANLVGLLLVSGTSSAAGDVLKDALARLQTRYETTRTLSADFHQTIESPTLATPLESKGTVAFEKPNRMRWEYEAPDPQLIVGDGTTLWIYQPDDKQAIKAPLGEVFQATTPVSFLAGLGHVDRDFTATLEREEPERWVAAPRAEGREAPRHARAGGAEVGRGGRRGAGHRLARDHDEAGALGREAERRPRSEALRFTPPPGVDVVKPPTY
jgi:hypothetical protein